MAQRFRSDWLLTHADHPLIADGVVDVDEAGVVTWSGPAADAPITEGSATTVDGLLMPGLVNAHCHTPMVLLRGAGEGLPLDRWLAEVMWPREARLSGEDVYWGMALGAAELLRRGVTTSSEMYFHAKDMAAAVRDVGLRSLIAPPLIEGNDAAFGDIDDQFAAAFELADGWRNDDRVDVALGPHSVYACSRHLLERVADASKAAELMVHIHVAELPAENAMCTDQHGLAVIPFLDDVGLLDGPLLAAHGVWLDDDDRGRLAAAPVGVAHCPTSNLRHANGIAPLAALRRAGIPVGLGTDGPASAPRLDLFAEIRLALGMARGSSLDADVLTPRQALGLATVGGAEVLGRNDLGSLRPGSKADMVSLPLTDSVFRPVVEPEDLVTNLVWAGSGSDVANVWVGGVPVVVQGAITTIDMDEAVSEVQQRAERIAVG